jgi:ABC-type antimicrobial peptide transport system permease subunit
MDQEMASSIVAPKFNTFVLGLFASLALFLAAIGIYGVLAYAVAQQTHENGVRMALGAQRRDVMRLILVQGARLALVGVVIGLLAAFGLTRLMATLLYGISASDPLTFALVAVALFAIGLLACYIPAAAPCASIPWSPFGTNDPSGQVSAKASFRTTSHGRQVLV